MRESVDRRADAVYLDLTDAASLESEGVADGIVVDYDAEGRIVGVEMLGPSRRTGGLETLMELSLELRGDPIVQTLQKNMEFDCKAMRLRVGEILTCKENRMTCNSVST